MFPAAKRRRAAQPFHPVLLSTEDIAAVTLPMAQAGEHLKPVLQDWGFAIVTDAAPPTEVARLRAVW